MTKKAKGTITTGRYIKQEELLRRNLMLSEAQVRVSRRAIEADALSRGKSVNNTDLLTTATRRLSASLYRANRCTKGSTGSWCRC